MELSSRLNPVALSRSDLKSCYEVDTLVSAVAIRGNHTNVSAWPQLWVTDSQVTNRISLRNRHTMCAVYYTALFAHWLSIVRVAIYLHSRLQLPQSIWTSRAESVLQRGLWVTRIYRGGFLFQRRFSFLNIKLNANICTKIFRNSH